MKRQLIATIMYSVLGTGLGLLVFNQTLAEVYKNIDAQGRVYFSDRPIKSSQSHSAQDYSAQGYSAQGYSEKANPAQAPDNSQLEKIANKLKAQRLKRQAQRDKKLKKAIKKQKQQQKKLAAAKKKKKACALARKKEDKAFRQRSQANNLSQAESALARYEKQRDIRATKCR